LAIIHQKGAEWTWSNQFETSSRRSHPRTTQLWQSMLLCQVKTSCKQHNISRHCSNKIVMPIDPKHDMSKTLKLIIY